MGDTLFRVVVLAALFFAGYNIGWSRGFECCKKTFNELFDEAIEATKARVEAKKSKPGNINDDPRFIRSGYQPTGKANDNVEEPHEGHYGYVYK